jgi:hypothetical protein
MLMFVVRLTPLGEIRKGVKESSKNEAISLH